MRRAPPQAALLPLARLRADLAAVAAPVAPRLVAPRAAIGAVRAADVVAADAAPPAAVALVAGHGVASIETVGASPYAPATPSRLVAVAAGEALPPGCDAVVPAAAVVHDFGFPAVQQAVAPGENLRRAGEDLAAATRLAAAGTRLAAATALLAETIGWETLPIRRPRVALAAAPDPAAARAAAWLAAALADGGGAETAVVPLADVAAAEAGLRLLVGAAEITPSDPALVTLAAAGEPLGHGVALTGLDSLAWGAIAGRPALVLPSRPAALVIARLALIEPLLAALAGGPDDGPGEVRPLTRKLVSQVGVAEIALLAGEPGVWRPLACGDLPWSALAAADAFVELAPESEGLAESAPLAARLLARPSRSIR